MSTPIMVRTNILSPVYPGRNQTHTTTSYLPLLFPPVTLPLTAAHDGIRSVINRYIGDIGGMDRLGSMPLFGAIHLSPGHLTSDAVFVNHIAKQLNNSSPNQDLAHNAILEYLLKTEFSPHHSERNLSAKEIKAYRAMFDRNNGIQIGSPLNIVSNNRQARAATHSDYFVRDYMQVVGSGGVSGVPLTIQDKQIIDGLLKKDNWFQIRFNDLSKRINEKGIGWITQLGNVAHRDGIQLIPSKTWMRYMGDKMQHVILDNNRIQSSGNLQGIFASDGTFDNLIIQNNRIGTHGKHTITIAGLLGGKIANNRDLNGNILPKEKIKLEPLRLGGGANIRVLSFHNANRLPDDPEYYEYAPLSPGSQSVTNNREKPQAREV